MSACCRDNVAVVQLMMRDTGHSYCEVPDPSPRLDDCRGGGWELRCLECGNILRECERCGFVGDSIDVSNFNMPFGDGWGGPNICRQCANEIREFVATKVVRV